MLLSHDAEYSRIPRLNNASQQCIAPSNETLSLAGFVLSPDRLSSLPYGQKDGYDIFNFTADFAALVIDGSTGTNIPIARTTTPPPMLPSPCPSHHRRLATEVATPFYFHSPITSASSELSKAAAMEKFKYILLVAPRNRDILPLLSWMATVLATNGKMEQLHDFVAECCHVFDQYDDQYSLLSTPYRYMLAYCEADEDGMNTHGSQFATGIERLIEVYGPCHSTVLISEYYCAWHEMSSPSGWTKARSMLETCLKKSEEEMGPCNLMTINCLAVLARGYAENDLHDHARSMFQSALHRLGAVAGPLEAYRLVILDRLAGEEEYLDNPDAALNGYKEVYERRLHCLSLHNEDTTAALLSLTQLLRRKGYYSEANRTEESYMTVRRTSGLGVK